MLCEFELYVQPIVAASSGRAVSCETLLRWNRPGPRVITPGGVIALAERGALFTGNDTFILEPSAAGVDRVLTGDLVASHSMILVLGTQPRSTHDDPQLRIWSGQCSVARKHIGT